MDNATRAFVRERAEHRCEYCLLAQDSCHFKHHIEHVVSKQHSGMDEIANLALACHRCNLRKGPNLTGIDPSTQEIVRLFDPRRENWNEHFRSVGVRIDGLTPIGRATVHVLAMNDTRRLELRLELKSN